MSDSLNEKLNKLRASVLGANDGIVSTAAVVTGVAGVTTATMPILISAIAATIGGATSMALGEYVSVSSQKDTEQAHGIEETVNPITAAVTSFVAFFLGALLPVLAAVLTPTSARVASIYVVTLIALGFTGAVAAKLSNTNVTRSVTRLVIGGTLALTITYVIGMITGHLLPSH